MAKVDRADQHLSHYERFSTVLNDDLCANQIEREENLKARERRYYFWDEPRVPPAFALLAGDVVHNLRSALDHLAYALCVGGPGFGSLSVGQQRQIAYPICAAGATPYNALNVRAIIAASAKPGAIDAIDATEPYKGGVGDLIRQIHILDNTDKHRLLVTMAVRSPHLDHAAYYKKIAASTGAIFIPMFLQDLAPLTRLKAGDVVFREPLEIEPHELMELAFPVAFDEMGISATHTMGELLHDMTQLVRSIIPPFEVLL